MYEYESPIKLIMDRMATEISERTDQNIWQAVQRVGVDVDKDELIRALKYDRGQYEKGYADAMKNAVPLDKLCEWLEENAEFPMEVEVKMFYEPTEEPEIKLNRMLNDAERWREKLTKWMEEQQNE